MTSSDAYAAALARSSSSQAWKRQRAACWALCAATPMPDGQPPGIPVVGEFVLATELDELALVVVVDVVEANVVASGRVCAVSDEQAPRATTSTSADATTTMGRGLTPTIQSPGAGDLRGGVQIAPSPG